MSESGASRAGSCMAALGALDACSISLAPTLVIVPMSFTEAQILQLPARGLHAPVVPADVRPIRSGRPGSSTASRSRSLTAVLATVLGTLAALGLSRGRFPGARSSTRSCSRRSIVPVVVIAIGMFGALRPVADQRLARRARARAHRPRAAVRGRQRRHVAADDGPQPRARGRQPRREPAPDASCTSRFPIILPGVRRGRDLRVHHVVGRGRRRDLHDVRPVPDAAGRDVGAGPPGGRPDRRGGVDVAPRWSRPALLLSSLLVVRTPGAGPMTRACADRPRPSAERAGPRPARAAQAVRRRRRRRRRRPRGRGGASS